MKFYAIIPARSGSKGVPGKNIKELNGQPLINYSIQAGLKSKYINEVYVSTDSKEYQDISISYGAKAPFLRPAEISRDLSTDFELMVHFLNWLKENDLEVPDFIVHLRPTTPLRSVRVIDSAIEYFLETKSTGTSLRSVHKMSESAYKTFQVSDENYLVSTFKNDPNLEASNRARQSFPDTFMGNGYIDILKTDLILNREMIHGDRVLSFETDPVVEVDCLFDFSILEAMVKNDDTACVELFGENYGRL